MNTDNKMIVKSFISFINIEKYVTYDSIDIIFSRLKNNSKININMYDDKLNISTDIKFHHNKQKSIINIIYDDRPKTHIDLIISFNTHDNNIEYIESCVKVNGFNNVYKIYTFNNKIRYIYYGIFAPGIDIKYRLTAVMNRDYSISMVDDSWYNSVINNHIKGGIYERGHNTTI